MPAVGEAGEAELRAEAGEEPGGDDEPELRAGEAELVAQVGEQRVHRAVAQRHHPRHEAVGHQAARPGGR